jgi:hypothetical protein
MKIIVFLVLSALLLTSCAGGADLDNLDFNRAISFTAEIEYNNSKVTADFNRTAIGEWAGVLTAPYALQGMKVNFTPTEMTVSYSDFDVSFNEAPTDINVSAFVMIKTLENAFMLQGVNITGGREGIEVAGIFDGDSYVLRLDKDGIPLSLEVPRTQLRVSFTSVRTAKFE